MIIKNLKKIISPVIFLIGYLYFIFTKKVNERVYQAYVHSYCLTSGYISKFISFFIIFTNKVFLKKIKKPKVDKELIHQINNDGYIILKEKINNQLTDNLTQLTKKLKCNYSKFDKNSEKVIFNEKLHRQPSYYYDSIELIKQKEVIDVIRYIDSLNISENYFNSKSYLISVNMWWSTISQTVDSFSAQDFHFDLDSIRWIKYFIYLTDVGIYDGPHAYVKNTHKSFSKPYAILKRGYSRISDTEIKNHYSSKNIHNIEGKRGTLIIGDTSCFHKGLVPKKSNRLIFEATFANSLFTNNESSLEINKIYKNKDLL